MSSYGETNIIIVGGISVNDEGNHDHNAYNFISAATNKAKQFPRGTVRLIVFAPSYEKRALAQRFESTKVGTANFVKSYLGIERDPHFFVEQLEKRASAIGFQLTFVRSGAMLTAALQSCRRIETLCYFGHANALGFLLDYSADGQGRATQRWTAEDASAVSPIVFAKGATFISYGCTQAAPDGMVQRLNRLWRIKASGAHSRTDYAPVQGNEWRPSTDKGWYTYAAPTPEQPTPPREYSTQYPER